jgi:hypothetical protein
MDDRQSKRIRVGGGWRADRGDVVGQGFLAAVAVAAGITAWKRHGWVRLATAILAVLCAAPVVMTVALLGGISLLARRGKRREDAADGNPWP